MFYKGSLGQHTCEMTGYSPGTPDATRKRLGAALELRARGDQRRTQGHVPVDELAECFGGVLRAVPGRRVPQRPGAAPSELHGDARDHLVPGQRASGRGKVAVVALTNDERFHAAMQQKMQAWGRSSAAWP